MSKVVQALPLDSSESKKRPYNRGDHANVCKKRMTNNKKSIEMDGDGVDLSVVFKAITQQWRVFFACLATALVLAVLACMLIPPRWSASATVRIGVIPSYGPAELPFGGPIEPVSEVEARVRLPDFAKGVFQEPALQGMTSADIALYRKTVKAVALRGTGLVTLNVAATSQDNARRVMEATVAWLQAAHDKKVQRATQQLRTRLQELNKQVANQQAELIHLKRNLGKEGQANTKKLGYEDLVAQDLIIRLEIELRALEKSRFAIQSLLLPPITYPTELVDQVTVGDKPYFPILRLFVMIAVIAGGMLGALLCLFFYQRRLAGVSSMARPTM
jgi:uncharacterized protein involved in exopolysaccharide biosynthesis